MGCDPGEWIDLAEDRDQWRDYIRAVMNLGSLIASYLVNCIVAGIYINTILVSVVTVLASRSKVRGFIPGRDC